MFEGLDDIFMTNTDKDDSDDDNDEKEPVNPLADVKPNMLTFPNGDCLYFEYEKQTMFAGPATNTEIIRKYAFAYDNALSSDANIQKLYDYILQQDPSLSILIEEDEPKIEPVVIEEKPKPTLYDRYMEVQNRYPDHIVIVRLGDFYEIFGDNATLIGNELEMTITSRELGNNHRFAMIGFPYHVSEAYFNRITQNHSIVIRESGNETVRNKIEPVKIENDGIIVDKKTGEVVEEQLPYDIKHIAILAELFGMENLEGC